MRTSLLEEERSMPNSAALLLSVIGIPGQVMLLDEQL